MVQKTKIVVYLWYRKPYKPCFGCIFMVQKSIYPKDMEQQEKLSKGHKKRFQASCSPATLFKSFRAREREIYQ